MADANDAYELALMGWAKAASGWSPNSVYQPYLGGGGSGTLLGASDPSSFYTYTSSTVVTKGV